MKLPCALLSRLILASALLSPLTVWSQPSNCVPSPPGLVGWWKAEENAQDQLGISHGILANQAGFGTGQAGRAFSFDGDGDVVLLTNSPLFRLQDFTLECWIRRANASIASFGANGHGAFFGYGPGGYIFYMDAQGRLLLGKTGIDGVSSSVAVTDLVFHHVAVTKSGGSVTFYVDGLPELAPAYNSTFTFSTPPAIGGRGDDFGNSFYGAIDELAVYSRALNAAELQAIYQAGSAGKCTGPAAPWVIVQPTNQTVFVGENTTFSILAVGTSPLIYQWRFDGTNISGANDAAFSLANVQFTNAGNYSVVVTNLYGSLTSSIAVLTVNPPAPCTPPAAGLVSWWRAEGNALDAASGNHGALLGNATYGPGRIGQAIVLDGSGDAVQLGTPVNLHLQNFTIETWIKRTSTISTSLDHPVFGNLFCWGDGGYALGLQSDGHLYLSKVGISKVGVDNAVTDTNWHHVAVTKSGSAVIFYVDGLAHPAAAYDPGFTFSTPLAIGAHGGSFGASFFGAIDELAVYARPLGGAEIQAIYSAGVSGKCVVPIPPTIVAHPQNATVLAGGNTSFSVAAGGSLPLNYQWRFNGTNISSATASTLALNNVQIGDAGNYSVQVTNVAGTTISSNALLTVNLPTPVVRIGSTSVMAGTRFTLPVTLVANGNENALGFSLTFNTQRLSLASVELGSGASGATMLVNSSLVWTGRVGIALAYPPQSSFAAGTQEVARLTFYSFPVIGAVPPSTIVVGDQPVLRELLNSQLQSITANYNNSTVTLLTTIFESDVSPRPNGNQAVSTSDWLQTARFAARLDSPTNSAEFQRADSAPRATLGNGQLKITDWVQAGRNLSGLDPLLAIGGPTNEVAPVLAGPSASRLLRVLNTNVLQGETATVSVLLDAQGDENAVGFTINFDPVALGIEGVALGADAAAATLQPNLLQAVAGGLGIALASPTGTAFTTGAREILQVTFSASSSSAGALPINISDQIVARCVSDVFAAELPLSFVNGTLTIDPILTSPLISISPLGTNVVLTWPVAAANFTLQSLDSTNGLSGDWSNTPVTLQTNGATVLVTLPGTNESRFFRLIHP